MKRKGRYSKAQQSRYSRQGWLREHPEDRKIDRENMKARKTGYFNDDVRHLMSAICLRACSDYKRACAGLKVGESRHNKKNPESVIQECREFFKGEMFQYFVNRMSVSEIEEMLRNSTVDVDKLWNEAKREQQIMEAE